MWYNEPSSPLNSVLVHEWLKEVKSKSNTKKRCQDEGGRVRKRSLQERGTRDSHIPLQVIPKAPEDPAIKRVAQTASLPWKSSKSHSIRWLEQPCGSSSPLRSSSCQHIQPLHTQIATTAAGINSDFQDQWQLWDLGANWCNTLSCPEHMEKQ